MGIRFCDVCGCSINRALDIHNDHCRHCESWYGRIFAIFCDRITELEW